MSTFILNQFDYLCFLNGLAFAVVATMCFCRESHGRHGLPWLWLGSFGLIQTGYEWLEGVALFFGDAPLFQIFRLGLLMSGFLCLGEFGRTGLKNSGRKVPGAWIFIPPVLLSWLAWFHSIALTFVLMRFLVGFPLILLAAAAFWNSRRHQPHQVYPWVALATGTLLFFALATGLQATPGAATVAEFLNLDPLYVLTGIPLFLFRALAIGLLAIAVWGISLHERTADPGAPESLALPRIWSWSLLLLVILAGGWIVTDFGGRRRDDQKRQLLLTQARMVAAALDTQQIARLTGTQADLDNPFYRLLKKRLVGIATANPEIRFAYLVGKIDKPLIFYAVSEPEESRDYVPPGFIYSDADPAFLHAFTSGQSFIIGPYQDRWGAWISAGVPLREPATRAVMALTCLDMQAADWYTDVSRKRLLQISIVLPFCLLLLTIFTGVRRNAAIANRITAEEKRFKTVFDSVQDAITIHNLATGDVLEANRRAYEMLGYQPGEIPAAQVMPFNAHEPPFDSVHADQWIRRAAAGEPQLFEWRTRHRSGRMFWIEVNLKRAQVGHRERLLAVVRDIDARKHIEEELLLSRAQLEQNIQERTAALAQANAMLQADLGNRRKIEEELRESENRFRTLVETESFGVLIVRGEHFLYVNPGAEKITGYSRQELMQRTFWDTVHPDNRGQVKEWGLSRQRGDTVPEQYSLKIIHRSGQTKWVLISVNSVHYGGQSANLVYFLDITELKQLEEAQEKWTRRLLSQRKLESLGAMAGGIAHDFNRLLMSVLGNADQIRVELPVKSPLHVNLDDIMLAVQRAASFAEKMMIYGGRGDFRPEPVELGAFLHSMIPYLTNFSSTKISITFNLAPVLSPIQADRNQIRQIMVNLLTNAVEAIGDNPGTVTLASGNMVATRPLLETLHLGETLDPGNYAFLEVIDTGTGMDEAARQRIFDPFFSTKFIGRGLGLPAVLGIVKFHQGAIRVDSAPGLGTTVRILFPLLAPGSAPASQEKAGWAGTVLIVDEDEALLLAVRQALTAANFAVLSATDREGALTVFTRRAKEIKLVILDVPVPGASVSHSLVRFRQISPRLPVILTGTFGSSEICCGLDVSPDTSYLQKPYQPEDLIQRIQQILANHE